MFQFSVATALIQATVVEFHHAVAGCWW